MPAKPVLVLQLRRMGDLILTFPLFIDIQRRFPGSPVWVAARQGFFEPLMPFAPNAVFFPPEHLPILARQSYEAVINLGGSDEAAACAGKAKAELKLGPMLINGNLHVEGFWHLHRENLTRNNRHNLFHWCDLSRMDFTPLPLPAITRQKPKPPGHGRIGMFIGASELAKRPEPEFWASLSSRLSGMGFKPVLLGGPAEKDLGEVIMAKGARAANFCGKTSIAQLAGLIRTFDLFITPDTGPMHLADWLGAPVLNLSMGPVQALETGPHSPGQHVLRPVMSCAGCWQCQRGRLRCRQTFHAPAIARITAAIARNEQDLHAPPGLELLTSGRNDLRLYSLAGRRDCAPLLLDTFWQAAFLCFYDARHRERLKNAANALAGRQPRLVISMRKTFAKVVASVAASRRKNEPLPENFWRSQPLHTRIFAGHIQMVLQNDDYSSPAFATAISRISETGEILAGRE